LTWHFTRLTRPKVHSMDQQIIDDTAPERALMGGAGWMRKGGRADGRDSRLLVNHSARGGSPGAAGGRRVRFRQRQALAAASAGGAELLRRPGRAIGAGTGATEGGLPPSNSQRAAANRGAAHRCCLPALLARAEPLGAVGGVPCTVPARAEEGGAEYFGRW
jgi:hypothetical protein